MVRLRRMLPLLALLLAWAGLGASVARAAHWSTHTAVAASLDGHCLVCEVASAPMVPAGPAVAIAWPDTVDAWVPDAPGARQAACAAPAIGHPSLRGPPSLRS